MDESLCAGHGRCFDFAPEVFSPDEDGINRDAGRTLDAPDDQGERIRAAARSCPEQAISLLGTAAP